MPATSGLLAALAAYVCSRFALRRLRALAARSAHTTDVPAGEAQGEWPSSIRTYTSRCG